MHRGVRKILLAQIVLTLAAAVVMVFVREPAAQPGLAAGFGGAMAMINSLWLARHSVRGRGFNSSPQSQTLLLMLGVAGRFVFTLVAFALGMGFFRLDPLALLVGFACAQLGSVTAGTAAQLNGVASADQFKR